MGRPSLIRTKEVHDDGSVVEIVVWQLTGIWARMSHESNY